jgi:hypothetical protein
LRPGGEGELNLAWHESKIEDKVADISLVAERTKRSAKWFSHQQWERERVTTLYSSTTRGKCSCIESQVKDEPLLTDHELRLGFPIGKEKCPFHRALLGSVECDSSHSNVMDEISRAVSDKPSLRLRCLDGQNAVHGISERSFLKRFETLQRADLERPAKAGLVTSRTNFGRATA